MEWKGGGGSGRGQVGGEGGRKKSQNTSVTSYLLSITVATGKFLKRTKQYLFLRNTKGYPSKPITSYPVPIS